MPPRLAQQHRHLKRRRPPANPERMPGLFLSCVTLYLAASSTRLHLPHVFSSLRLPPQLELEYAMQSIDNLGLLNFNREARQSLQELILLTGDLIALAPHESLHMSRAGLDCAVSGARGARLDCAGGGGGSRPWWHDGALLSQTGYSLESLLCLLLASLLAHPPRSARPIPVSFPFCLAQRTSLRASG